MPLRESQRDVDPRTALGRVVENDEDVLVCNRFARSEGNAASAALL